MIIRVCVGSACHLKGSEEIIELLQNAIAEHGLDLEITLGGIFCTGHCSPAGVTVEVDDVLYTVSRENFKEFFREHILTPIKEGMR
ncbi:MAG: (2Fe-2S) ferredoxin domain-containing protein [Clostridiales bacterium]|nr:(2Fe-2S) ferredoxin domain-containing protein [Clostridiales bacterium]MBQ3107962.1 (2Fe-2S) ferredoxin domain-containing protein [Bacillota bacterium]